MFEVDHVKLYRRKLEGVVDIGNSANEVKFLAKELTRFLIDRHVRKLLSLVIYAEFLPISLFLLAQCPEPANVSHILQKMSLLFEVLTNFNIGLTQLF